MKADATTIISGFVGSLFVFATVYSVDVILGNAPNDIALAAASFENGTTMPVEDNLRIETFGSFQFLADPQPIFANKSRGFVADCPGDWEWHSADAPSPKQCFQFNLFFLKGPKTGSSTMGGVARRIASRYGLNCATCSLKDSFNATEPHLVSNHIKSHMIQEHEQKSVLETFKWGLSRDPISRCLSAYYMHRVTRAGDIPTPEKIIEWTSENCADNIWNYYDLENPLSRNSMRFVGVTERFAESSLVLAFLMGLSLGDILYVPSKVSSQKVEDIISFREKSLADTGLDGNRTVAATVYFDQQSPEVKAFLSSPAFLQQNEKDFLLHRVAHFTLDNYIARIGNDRFQATLKEFQDHLNAVKAQCKVYDDKGKRLDSASCYWGDNGCAYECLDTYANENNLWVPLQGSFSLL